ncbi:hypothetical protein Tco_1002741 [Tanacetum coccineum]|uniref:Reverse transcriptase domain-containing protein n=1 Tax=Tanacetum coccineum TaxID=301880 RepID=A0ABQ5F8K8_9ASTR
MGSRADGGIQTEDALKPSPVHETEMPEICLPLRKRPCRTTPGPGYEVRESSAAGAARQLDLTPAGQSFIGLSIDDLDAALGTPDEEPEYLVPAWAQSMDALSYHTFRGHNHLDYDLLKSTIGDETLSGGTKDSEEPQYPDETSFRDSKYSAKRILRARATKRRPEQFLDWVMTLATVTVLLKKAPNKETSRSTLVTTTPPPSQDPTYQTNIGVTSAQLQAMIDQGVTAVLAARDTTRNGDDSHTSGTGGHRRSATLPMFRGWKTVFRIRPVTNDVAYAMTWTDLKKKMTTKYCPRNEIKKIEAELWNLKVKGTDVYVEDARPRIYTQVLCIEAKNHQEAIEMATELMDRRINTFAERQAENKRKFEDTSRNNQNQQQNKRQNTGRAYAAGNGGQRKRDDRTKPQCPKCNFQPIRPCIPHAITARAKPPGPRTVGPPCQLANNNTNNRK